MSSVVEFENHAWVKPYAIWDLWILGWGAIVFANIK